ncbi:hypothetical protein Acr_05g0012490 [Actinidia rufa]|uniref:Uncharacterized protein n=1 Tax=Actinidia rufa TaxID=165716 RepID=A0A7J0EMS3_9ERIC|nr:hypothetical protein Acr_05g0012490 [Actinidia rufa]
MKRGIESLCEVYAIEQGGFSHRNDEDNAQKVLEEMIVLAGAKTGFLIILIDHLVESMLLVTEVKGAEDKTRELAIEFVLTVAEDGNQGCGMIVKLNKRITRLLGIVIKMLVFIEDDLSWHKAGDENNAGESDAFLYGMESLGRLAAATQLFPITQIFYRSSWLIRIGEHHTTVTANAGESDVFLYGMESLGRLAAAKTQLFPITQIFYRSSWLIRIGERHTYGYCP